MTTDDYLIAQGDDGLCPMCKLRLRMSSGDICSPCHGAFMYWLFRGHHYEIREFRDAGKGG
jgi:hypothetical protein